VARFGLSSTWKATTIGKLEDVGILGVPARAQQPLPSLGKLERRPPMQSLLLEGTTLGKLEDTGILPETARAQQSSFSRKARAKANHAIAVGGGPLL